MTNVTHAKFWQLIWETYALDPDEDRPVPMETKETICWIKPSRREIDQMRKHAHRLGFRLVAFNECNAYNHDEF